MKKQLFFTGFLFVLFIGLSLTGCASTNYVFDKSIPEENLSIIKFPFTLSIVKFDDKDVKWTPDYIWGYYPDKDKLAITVKIPAGEHTLIINYYSSENRGAYTETRTAKGIEIKYDFQPGNTYSITPAIVGYNKMTIRIDKLSEEKKTK
jgi:hypothetical protein